MRRLMDRVAVAAPPERNRTRVLVVLLLACSSFALSQTLVVPALPEIARHLHTTGSAVSWVLTAFLLSASISTPIIGRLGDLFGKGRVLAITMLVFSAGAVISASAGLIGILVAGRALQGVAGAVFPLAFGIVRDTFPRERIAGGLSTIAAIFGIGAGIGLPLSGVIVENLNFHWLFWITLPLALPAALAAYTLIPSSPTIEHVRIDWLGALLLSISLAAVLLGASQANAWGWGSVANVVAIGGGVAVAALFVGVETRVGEPLIDLVVFRRRAVWTSNLTGFMVGATLFTVFLTVPQFAQTPSTLGYGFGASVTIAGLMLLPMALAQLAAGPISGRLDRWIGFRAVLAAGGALAGLGALLLAVAHGHVWEVMLASALTGAGVTFALGAMTNLVVAAVPQSEVGIATGINTVTRTVGGAFGAALATSILTGDLNASSGFPSESAYTQAFALAAIAGLLAVGAALLVPHQGEDAEG